MTRILIFAPHPDDVEIFAGGALLRHLHDGATARIVMMTLGEKGSVLSLLGAARQAAVKQTRMRELEARLTHTPSVELGLLDLPDRGVVNDADAAHRVRAEIDAFAPTCIYLPESTREASYYIHPDHLATGALVESALTPSRDVTLRYYHPKHPTTYVDVTPFHQQNLNALRSYRSQYGATASPPFLLYLIEADIYFRARRCGKQAGVRLAEAFREVKPRLQ